MNRQAYARAFIDCDINREEVEQSLLNIDNKVRTNLFPWNGQFSPQFIEALIDRYVDEHDTVFDPFLGSGTILYECARRNIASMGVELNPSAYYMAKVYEICSLNKSERNIVIDEINNIIYSIINVEEIISTLYTKISSTQDKYMRDTLSLLVVLMDLFNNELSTELLYEKWIKLKQTIASLPYSDKKISASLGDARSTNLTENSIDIVITSPPYINVFNYHQKYRRSVEALGYDVLKIAKKEVGSNRKNRGNRLLTVIQYCIDMALAFQEMVRLGNNNARFILVVGRESNVLSLGFCNSELIYNIATRIFELEFILKQQRVFKNKFGKMIYEDILHFKNNKKQFAILSKDEIINMARQVAKHSLEEKLRQIDEKSKSYESLVSAISNINEVNQSEE